MSLRGGLALAAFIATNAASALAAPPQDKLSEAPDGATCDYYNRGAGGAWQQRGGDWLDADGRAQGDRPYASAAIQADAVRLRRDFDITALAKEWSNGRRDPAYGLALRSTGPRQGITEILSRETADPSSRPTLTLNLADGTHRVLDAQADTYLDCTTEKGLGGEPRLLAGQAYTALLRFDIPADLQQATIAKAVLAITVNKEYGDSSLGVFATHPPTSPDAAVRMGIASAYPNDAGIERSPDVWFATGFERPLWQTEWSEYDPRSSADVVQADAAHAFAPLSGKALRVKLPKGVNLGLDLHFAFRKAPGGEPEEAYFRYYLRLADDWSPNVDGGKLPGFAGTYGRAGWGLRKSTGADGWSMRGNFFVQPTPSNPYRGFTAIGTYAYHADIAEPSGEEWHWPLGRLGALERNRWYCVEQYFKVNTVGQSDGVLRAWIDGHLVFERKAIRVRTVPDLKIEEVWFNVYHGGVTPSPRDMHMYIDNVVIAKKYIGPLARGH